MHGYLLLIADTHKYCIRSVPRKVKITDKKSVWEQTNNVRDNLSDPLNLNLPLAWF